jgi:hypothetical protein
MTSVVSALVLQTSRDEAGIPASTLVFPPCPFFTVGLAMRDIEGGGCACYEQGHRTGHRRVALPVW